MQFKNVQLVDYFDSINEAIESVFVFWLYQYIYYRFIVNEQPLLVCNEGIEGWVKTIFDLDFSFYVQIYVQIWTQIKNDP